MSLRQGILPVTTPDVSGRRGDTEVQPELPARRGAGGGDDDGGPSIHKRMKRFAEYSKYAILYEVPLATVMLARRTDTFAGLAQVGIMLHLVALFLDGLVAIWPCIVSAHGVPVYVSFVLLMAMPYFLLLSLNVLYAFLALALVPILLLVVLLLFKELRRGAEAGEEFPRPRDESGEMVIMSYDDYNGKLKKLFNESAAVNTIAGAGLSSHIFHYSNYSPAHDVISVSEILLFLTIIASRFVMLVSTARPMFRQPSTPPRFAGFLEHLSGSLPVLLSLTAIAGAADFLGGLALLGFSLDFLEQTLIFKSKFYSEEVEVDRAGEQRPDADLQERLDSLRLLRLGFMYFIFMALVALYLELAGKDLGVLHKARVLLYFWAFCCCKLDGEGKLPLLTAVDGPRDRFSWLGHARSAVMGLAALDWLSRIAMMFLINNKASSGEDYHN